MEKTIDQLIAEAPDYPDGTTEYFIKHKTYSLLNSREALRMFKKLRLYNVPRPAGRKGTRRLNKRIFGHGICYTTPYIPRKVTKLPEYSFNGQYYGAYFKGFYTNNLILLGCPGPRLKSHYRMARRTMRGSLIWYAGRR